MGIECNYSFESLYSAAYGRNMNIREKRAFEKFSQEEINTLVLQWSKEAGWKTRKKKGTDGFTYLSFHP